MARQRNTGSRIAAEERRRIALELRKAGATFEQIGKSLGIRKQSAHELVAKALKEAETKTAETAAQVKALELMRLDDLLKGLWPAASKGNPQSVEKALKVMERRAKLLGLDAPTKHAHTDPTGEEERGYPVAFPVPPHLDPDAWQKFAAQAAREAQTDG